jgi:DNA-binding CsgD family transcriptional regulator
MTMTIGPADGLEIGLTNTNLSEPTDTKHDNLVSPQAPPARHTANRGDPQSGGGPAGPDQLLLDAFLGARRRIKGPLVAASDRTMIANASACELLQPADRRLLWEWARRAIGDGRRDHEILRLSSSMTVRARCRPVGHKIRPLGAVIQLALDTKTRTIRSLEKTSAPDAFTATLCDPSIMTGWVELTDAERTVAELVARGLTNKETGRQMFLSHHTVDCHLRRVFRKLGVSSRVELARIVGEHYEALSDRALAHVDR